MGVGKPTILLVDDEDVFRVHLAAYLADKGYHVIDAADGEQALVLLKEHGASLALIDLSMPGMDGFETMAGVQRLSPRTVCVVISGIGSMQDVVRALEQGAWQYVSKPIRHMGYLDHVVRTGLERARLTRDIQQYRSRLERVGAFSARQISLARKEAETAKQLKEHILANMSHELRTPLNGIMGMAQMMINSDLPGTQRRYMEMVMQSSRTLLDVVNNILTLSTIKNGVMELAEKPFDLGGLLRSLADLAGRKARDKGLSFRMRLADDVPGMLMGDPTRLSQLLINMVDNAVKFTEQGEVALEVELDRTASGSDLPPLLFKVSDTGVGIEPVRLNTIFESFTLGEDVLTKRYSGPGLGLAIARELAIKMGGGIRVESDKARGSVFTVSVRLQRATAEEAQSAPEGWTSARSERKLRILLGEDERVNQIYVCRALEKLGHEVAVAGDGEQVLALLAQERFDVVLMDIQMPNLNGLDATRAIRKGARGVPSDIPVVALTAFAMERDRQAAMEAGMDDYLSKPFDVETLVTVIEKTVASPRLP